MQIKYLEETCQTYTFQLMKIESFVPRQRVSFMEVSVTDSDQQAKADTTIDTDSILRGILYHFSHNLITSKN